MAKSYVKFETQKDVSSRILEVLRLAKQSGAIKKGANEVTKSVERGLANFVVMAEDVEPEEVVMHIPTICEQKKIPFGYVPTKMDLGKALGINVPCAAASVERPGEAEHVMKEVIAKLTGKTPAPAEKQAAAPAGQAAKEQKPRQPKEQKSKQAPKPDAVPAQEQQKPAA
jgi:large subunit ribosomal protein L7Ae